MADSAAVHDHAPATPASAAAPKRRRSMAPLIIAALIAIIGVAVIGSSTSGGAGMYNYSLADLVQQKDAIDGQNVKVAGRIAKGSVRGEPASKSFRFDLTDEESNKIPIAYTKLLPDPFEEGREAIVQGTLKAGVLHATSLTVKCPSRYEDSEQFSPESVERYSGIDPKQHAAQKARDKGAK